MAVEVDVSYRQFELVLVEWAPLSNWSISVFYFREARNIT